MPPRAQRLYSRMRERPPEFRVNEGWPLFSNLVFGVAPTLAGIRRFGLANEFLIQNQSSDYKIEWDQTTKRLCVSGNFLGPNYFYANTRYRRFVRSPVTMFGIFRPIATSSLYSNAIVSQTDRNLTYCGHLLLVGNNGYSGFERRPYVIYAISHTSNSLMVRSDVQLSLGETVAIASTWDGTVESNVAIFVKGNKTPTTVENNTLSGDAEIVSRYVYIGRDNETLTSVGWNAAFGDALILNVVLPETLIAEFSDPSNVDLRVGGVPLILPPRRRLWPVSPVAEAVFLKRRNLGLRAGTREAVI